MDKKGISRAGIVGIVVVIVIIAAAAGYFLLGGGPSEEGENPIKIGVIGPMKQMTGKQHKWGAELAIKQINRQGGVLGRPLKMVTADTEADPTVARSAFNRLIKQEDVDVMVGGQRTEAVLTMQDMLAEHEMIFIGCGASSDILCDRVGEDYEKYKYFFMQSPYPSSHMGRALIYGALQVISTQIAPALGEEPKVAIVTEAIEWGETMEAAYKQFLGAYGIPIVQNVKIGSQATDVSSELSIIEGSEANIILMAISGTVGTQFAKQWGEMEVDAFPIGINVEAQELGFWDRTEGKGEYLVGSHNQGIDNASIISKDVFNYFTENYGEYPSYNGYGAYDGIFSWAEAVERAGTLEADNVIEEMEYTPDPMEYAKFEKFGKKVPQGCGSFSQQATGFNENHYWPNYPYQPLKTIETVVGPQKTLGGWVYGEWLDGDKLVIYPGAYAESELVIPPWMTE